MTLKRIQLGLVHVAVAMTLVPINSTLNRVMIKDLAISATIVAILASLPYLFAPIQVVIGSFSDRHPIFGLRRTPYIVLGLLLTVAGVIIAPYVAFLLATNWWAGIVVGLLAFGAWGMGYNFASVSYISLASELSGEQGRGRTIAVMWFMMITGIILTAITLSQLVDPYTPEALVRAFWIIGLAAFLLGIVGLIKLEPNKGEIQSRDSENYSWNVLFHTVVDNQQAKLFFWYLVILLTALLGQDILLEPFGAEAFGLSVKDTTRITSLWGVCVLVALLAAGALEGRVNKRIVAKVGGWTAFLGFVLIPASGLVISSSVFYLGVIMLGIGTGLSTVSNLSLMLDMTIATNVGLFIGAWGMANALSRLLGTVLGGIVRDVVTQVTQGAVLGYIVVFGIEALMLLISLFMLGRINVNAFRKQTQEEPTLAERMAMAGEV